MSIVVGEKLGLVSFSEPLNAEDCIALYKVKNSDGNVLFDNSDVAFIQNYARALNIYLKEDNKYVSLYDVQCACDINSGSALFVRTEDDGNLDDKIWKASAERISGLPLFLCVIGVCFSVIGDEYASNVVTKMLTKELDLRSLNTDKGYRPERVEGIKPEVRNMLRKFKSMISSTQAFAMLSDAKEKWTSQVKNDWNTNKQDTKIRLSDTAEIEGLIRIILNDDEPRNYETNSFHVTLFVISLISMGFRIGLCHEGHLADGSNDQMVVYYMTRAAANIDKRIPVGQVDESRQTDEYELYPNPEPVVCNLVFLEEALPKSYATKKSELNTLVSLWDKGREISRAFNITVNNKFNFDCEEVMVIGKLESYPLHEFNVADQAKIKAAERMLSLIDESLECLAPYIHTALCSSEEGYNSIAKFHMKLECISDLHIRYMCLMDGLSWGLTRNMVLNTEMVKRFAHITTDKLELFKFDISMIKSMCTGTMNTDGLLQWIFVQQFGDSVSTQIEKRSIGRWNQKFFSMFKFAVDVNGDERECIKMWCYPVAPANITRTHKGNVVAAQTRVTIKDISSSNVVLSTVESSDPDISAIISIEPDYEGSTQGMVHVARTSGSVIDYIDIIKTTANIWNRTPAFQCTAACSDAEKSTLEEAFAVNTIDIIKGRIPTCTLINSKGLAQVGQDKAWRYIAMGTLNNKKTVMVNNCISCASKHIPERMKKSALIYIGGP